MRNWQNLNEQILIHKKQLDDAILSDLRAHGTIDVDRIKEILKLLKQPEESVIDNSIADYSSALLSEAFKDFISNQPKMNRGLRWRYELLQKIIINNDRVCKVIRVPYLHEILDEFRGNVNANTGYTRYKNFKRFVTWCQDGGYPLPRIEWKRLSKPTFKPDFIFLTDERIKELSDYAPKSEFEESIKNIFLVLIYTGMRYSDYFHLNIKTDIHNGCIDKVARKTKVRFKIPIHDAIKHILKNPPKMSGQKVNKGIQSIGKTLGWTEVIRYRKDINEFVTVPFYDMLCTSVGRHTFATRALLNGIPHNIIMGWCGWTNSDMLFYYSEKMKLQTTDWMAKLK
ncbi:MAG: hypothetical protein KF763_13140 [Cyclobacteriaceae bacterium]|nr:hypothetical protein [Cyclobacteriaceae bacterium]